MQPSALDIAHHQPRPCCAYCWLQKHPDRAARRAIGDFAAMRTIHCECSWKFECAAPLIVLPIEKSRRGAGDQLRNNTEALLSFAARKPSTRFVLRTEELTRYGFESLLHWLAPLDSAAPIGPPSEHRFNAAAHSPCPTFFNRSAHRVIPAADPCSRCPSRLLRDFEQTGASSRSGPPYRPTYGNCTVLRARESTALPRATTSLVGSPRCPARGDCAARFRVRNNGGGCPAEGPGVVRCTTHQSGGPVPWVARSQGLPSYPYSRF